jgi:glutathionylspermidine synthase
VEQQGLTWHSSPQPYWNEAAFYEFTASEVDALECATNQLAQMTLATAEFVIRERQYARLNIPDLAIPLIERSWQMDAPSLYGRFDLAYDGVHPPKLLEYNADTPTSLLEAAVVQWFWLQDMFPALDQFNSLHERLIECWKHLTPALPGNQIDFCSTDDAEDGMTVTYLMDTAQQAGLRTAMFPIDEIGWDGRGFIAPGGGALRAVFKLYPWEWMMHEEFGQYLSSADTLWIEPAWKMLLSNKAILPVLWDLYPGHPNLLEARLDGPGAMEHWVRKPLLGREGANVTLYDGAAEISTAGEYGEEGFVYQALAPLQSFGGRHAVIGSWLVGHQPGNAAGIGIRESAGRIITNTSQFVPHVIA